jgi:hypothetical protein
VETYIARKGPLYANAVNASCIRSLIAAIDPGAWPVGMITHQGGNQTSNYNDCSKRKEAKTAVAMRTLRERGRRDGVSTFLPAPKSAPPKPAHEQEAFGTARKHIVRGGCINKTHATSAAMPNSSDLDSQCEHQAAHLCGLSTSAGPETPTVNPTH